MSSPEMTMRLHIQNVAGETGDFLFTPAQLAAAAARANRPVPEASYGVTADDFAAGMAKADILVGGPASFSGRFPVHAPSLKMIFSTGAGVDKLQPFDWLPEGVVLLNNRGTHANKAFEYSAMALLMLNARIPKAIAAQRTQTWSPNQRPTLQGRPVTVIGAGHLGTGAARAARTFGAQVTGLRTTAAPHPDFDRMLGIEALDSILPETEFLIITCPLTPQTKNLLDRRRLSLLPKDAALCNIGRGPLIDQDALCDLLDSGHLSGAVLDVVTPEPLPKDSRVWTTQNLVVTPHDGIDDRARYNPDSLDIFFRNLTAFEAGHPLPNRVDPARGY